MNLHMTSEMADNDDVPVRAGRVKDDVASAPLEGADCHRGASGMVFTFKVTGATGSMPWMPATIV